MDNLGIRIKVFRIIKGMDQTELAEKAKVGQSSIARIERGIDPSMRTLRKIAVALDVELSVLFSNDLLERLDNDK